MNEFNSHSLDHVKDQLDVKVRTISHKNSYDFTSIHRHEYFEFILFESGCGGTQLIDFKTFYIEPNSIFIISPNQVHLMKRKPFENGLLVQFTREFLNYSVHPFQVEFLFQIANSPKIILENETFARIHSLMVNLKYEIDEKSEYKTQKIKHLFGILFFEILSCTSSQLQSSHKTTCAFNFLFEVEKNYKQIRNVKKYAELLKVPINTLTSDVKRQFGKSPLNLIHEIILIEIKRLLIVEGLNHKEIAYTLNFDSQSSYSRFVKQKTSLTPNELKNEVYLIAQQ